MKDRDPVQQQILLEGRAVELCERATIRPCEASRCLARLEKVTHDAMGGTWL